MTTSRPNCRYVELSKQDTDCMKKKLRAVNYLGYRNGDVAKKHGTFSKGRRQLEEGGRVLHSKVLHSRFSWVPWNLASQTGSPHTITTS
jgi:hypothetical protein